jgi:DNA-nicking Smr family endonuclease
MQDDDFSLFKAEVRGVKPIKHDRAEVGKPKADRQKLAGLRQAATVRSDKAWSSTACPTSSSSTSAPKTS